MFITNLTGEERRTRSDRLLKTVLNDKDLQPETTIEEYLKKARILRSETAWKLIKSFKPD